MGISDCPCQNLSQNLLVRRFICDLCSWEWTWMTCTIGSAPHSPLAKPCWWISRNCNLNPVLMNTENMLKLIMWQYFHSLVALTSPHPPSIFLVIKWQLHIQQGVQFPFVFSTNEQAFTLSKIVNKDAPSPTTWRVYVLEFGGLLLCGKLICMYQITCLKSCQHCHHYWWGLILLNLFIIRMGARTSNEPGFLQFCHFSSTIHFYHGSSPRFRSQQ